MENKKFDIVANPSHYCFSKFEPKDVIREWGLNFNLGNAVKYIARAGRKDDIIQDLRKAKQYIEFEIEYLEQHRGEKDNIILDLEDLKKEKKYLDSKIEYLEKQRGEKDEH